MAAERIAESTVVGEFVVKHSDMRELLERLGIDYCCGGKHTLREAAEEKGVDLSKLLTELNHAMAKPSTDKKPSKDWSTSSLTELVDHIEARHHAFMKEQMPRLEAILAKVSRAHRASHGEMLEALSQVFAAFKEEIDAHLIKEESILFPAIRRIEASHADGAMLECPVHQMQYEHDQAGHALKRMRELTGNYALPVDACPTFAALYDGLKAVEADLHEHIHLENNILFPRALAQIGSV